MDKFYLNQLIQYLCLSKQLCVERIEENDGVSDYLYDSYIKLFDRLNEFIVEINEIKKHI